MTQTQHTTFTDDYIRRPKILVVEDETAQREVLVYNLEADGLTVLSAKCGEEALTLARANRPDLVILDWMMPSLSGIAVCGQLKADQGLRHIPIIMLSARSEEADRLHGLGAGADDYIVKPFFVFELIACVHAHLRRCSLSGVGAIRKFDDIVLNTETHRVHRQGRPISLGPKEFRLLSALIEKPGKVWSREQLLEQVWQRDGTGDTRTVDVHIGRLRKAIFQENGQYPLRTVRGVGYSLG